ncbi:MAG: hypothetical protein ACYC7E_07850 [Armatimonadota bacterium]
MNVASAMYDSVERAEAAVRALRNANFPYDHIAVFTRYRDKGLQLADDLGRDYRGGEPPDDAIIPQDIYANVSPAFVDIIHRSDLPDEAVYWYRERLDAGDILIIVNVENRMEDADRILIQHSGYLYRDRARLLEPTDIDTATGTAGPGPVGASDRPPRTTTEGSDQEAEDERRRRRRPAA